MTWDLPQGPVDPFVEPLAVQFLGR